jgi:predicted nucleic acid-binding protein
VLVDTNVVFDVLLEREPYVSDSTSLLAAIEQGDLSGLVGATSVTTIHYLAAKAVGGRRARTHVETLLDLLEVAPVNGDVLERALSLGYSDFEDAVLHEAGAMAGADAVVTRNANDFRLATLDVYTPTALLATLRRR